MSSQPDITHLFVHTFVQKRIVSTQDTDKGTRTEVPAKIDTHRGRLVPVSNSDKLRGEREEARVTHAIYLPAATDVIRNDQFVFNGRTFRVVVPNITPSVAIYQKILTEEVQDGGS